jgi:predicted enzyme related to lactoylglutathione lyase
MLEAKVYAELQIRGYPTPRQPGGIIVDRDNHQYALRQTASMSMWADDESPPSLQELHIGVTDMAESLLFYGETLGLVLLHQDKKSATFATGNIKLVLQDWQTLTGQPLNRPDGSLIVFNTERIQQTYEELSKNGLRFKSEVVYSDIGGSARFTDPTGHVFCLYERSEESLSWGSGWKVREIISRESSLSLGQVIIDT